MKTPAEIETRLREIIHSQLDTPHDKITCKSSIIEDLGADSLDQIEMLLWVEDEFHCEISEAEAEKIETLGDAVALLTRKSAEGL